MSNAATRVLKLVKGRHVHLITYEVGRESEVLDVMISMVQRVDIPFDWFDAAVLSHQLGAQIAGDLKKLMRKAQKRKT